MDNIRCYRPLIIGRRGAVAANHPLAAQAGLMALRAGGNAVDAAVATALALAVVEPMMSGLGGDGFYTIFDAASGRATVVNGTGPAPDAATPERYAAGIPRTGPMSVSVPGLVAGLGMMHRDHGRLKWRELFAEAIRHAREGFGATPHYREFAGEHLRLPARRPAQRRGVPAERRGAAGRQADRAARPRAHARGDRGRGGRVFLSRRAGAAARCGMRRGRRRRSARPISPNSRPSGRSRSASTIAARRCSKRRSNSTGFMLLQELKIAENFDLRSDGSRLGRSRCMSWSRPRSSPSPTASAGAPTRAASTRRSIELLSADYAARLASRIDRAAPRRPARSPTRPATRPISAPSTATATRFRASRASTAPGARG